MSDSAILRNTQGPLQVTFYSGEDAVAATGEVTVTVTGIGGTTIATAGTATAGTAIGVGVYLYDLDPQTELDLLTAAWTGQFGNEVQTVQTTTEVQGAFHVSIAEIRALDGLSSETKYPYQRLSEVRRWWEDLSEGFCGVSFVPRYGYDILDGSGTESIILDRIHPTSLRWVEIDGDRVSDLSEWVVYDSGKVVRADGGYFPSGWGNVTVKYEHGYTSPASDLREAAMVAIRYKLIGDRSGIPERATTMTTDVGAYTLSLAGANRPTGIPEVDAALISYREIVAVVG